jgi:hypothetical protein
MRRVRALHLVPPAQAGDDLVPITMLVSRKAIRALVGNVGEMISQRNCENEGIGPRLFLETLRRPDFDLPITSLGKLRLVERAAFVAWLRSHAVRKTTPVPTANDADANGDEYAGLVRAAGGRVNS